MIVSRESKSSEPASGTLKTVRYCEQLGKPFLVIDGLRVIADAAAGQAAAFVHASSIKVLNVAGPRESKHAGAQIFGEQVVQRLLTFDTC